MTNRLNLAGAVALAVLMAGCGGGGGGDDGGGSSGEPNVVPIIVDGGPASVKNVNQPFVSVTICEPGNSSNCQTIDHVLLDTGSTGLRILYSQLDSRLNLPRQTTNNGNNLAECAAFITGYTFGTVRKADVRLGDQTASSLSIQVIADPAVTDVPSSCSSRGSFQMNTLNTLGAKGILGIGWYKEDCAVCAAQAVAGAYYSCFSTAAYSCSPITVSLDRQVRNPVTAMASNNNGVLVEMDSVPATGAMTAAGKLYLGIGTQSNNALGSAVVYDLDADGNLKTEYKGTTFSAFVDSGSNGLYFPDDSISTCLFNTKAPDFFCPSSTLNLTATIVGATNGKRGTVNFSIANADRLVRDNGFAAFNNIGAPLAAVTGFDWGLPFFYGRRVFVAVEDYDTSGGKGPYIAY